jgi:dihydrofolate synthase/folylpolyglutamate synthase
MDSGWNISFDIVRKALYSVKETMGPRGRWDFLQRSPIIIADVAHNPDGIAAVVKDWNNIQGREKHIILGFVRDKDVRTALAQFPKDNIYHFCAAAIPRALPADELAAIATELGLIGTVHPSVREAVADTKKQLRDDVPLLITGSFFIVGEAMEALGIEP